VAVVTNGILNSFTSIPLQSIDALIGLSSEIIKTPFLIL